MPAALTAPLAQTVNVNGIVEVLLAATAEKAIVNIEVHVSDSLGNPLPSLVYQMTPSNFLSAMQAASGT